MNRFSRILHHTDINDIKQKNSDRIAVLKLEEQERKNKLIKLRELSNPNFSDWRTDLEEGMTTKGTFQTVLGGQGEENLSDYDSCKGMSLSQYQRNLKKQHKNIKIQK